MKPNGPGGPSEFAAQPATLRKLTQNEYLRTIEDLFGADVRLPEDLVLEPDTAKTGFFAIGASSATYSPVAIEKLETAAYALADQALAASRSDRDTFVGCTPRSVSDATCTSSFLTRFGLRVFRRPLTTEEVERYAAVATQASNALGDFHQGLAFGLAALLQAPSFLFRVELGEPDPEDPTRRRFTNYEMAQRLSYTLWNSTPDALLLEAAARGELVTLEGVRSATTRMLADPRAKRALDNFHTERLGLDELTLLDKDPSVYADVDDVLREAMLGDVLDTFEELTFTPGHSFLESFDSPISYVNAPLAEIYGVSVSMDALTHDSARTRVLLPSDSPRAGLLGKPAYLALYAHDKATSPTRRGKFIRERLLCQSIPAPPPNVVTTLPEPDPNLPTLRDRLTAHAENDACKSCHKRMDPLGLPLEHFDPIGRYRELDNGHVIDATGDLDGVPFDGARELASLLREDPRTAECIARHVYRYAVGHVESRGEAPAITALIQAFEDSDYQLLALLSAVTESDGFRFAAMEQAP